MSSELIISQGPTLEALLRWILSTPHILVCLYYGTQFEQHGEADRKQERI